MSLLSFLVYKQVQNRPTDQTVSKGKALSYTKVTQGEITSPSESAKKFCASLYSVEHQKHLHFVHRLVQTNTKIANKKKERKGWVGHFTHQKQTKSYKITYTRDK